MIMEELKKEQAKKLREETIRVHENKETGVEFRASRYVDNKSGVVNVKVVVIAKGKEAYVKKINKGQIINRNLYALQGLHDLDFNINSSNLRTVAEKIRSMIYDEEIPKIEDTEKISMEDFYKTICDYAKENEEDDVITFSDGYCNMKVDKFNKKVAEIAEGYTNLDIKKWLKEMYLLRTNKGRPYDYNMTDTKGKAYRVISFKYYEENVKGDVDNEN